VEEADESTRKHEHVVKILQVRRLVGAVSRNGFQLSVFRSCGFLIFLFFPVSATIGTAPRSLMIRSTVLVLHSHDCHDRERVRAVFGDRVFFLFSADSPMIP
jgi:hypothetical protein